MSSYTSTFGTKNIIIGISGIIGVGKSTLAKELGKYLNTNVLYEPVETNEYLEKFYQDIKKYSFSMQVYLLNKRFKQHQQMIWSDKNTIQDRTIYEDVIFAKMLFEDNLMEELDFKTYVDLFSNMTNFLHRPDIILYLDVYPEKAFERVKNRNRKCESNLSLEYLFKLKKGYEDWLNDVKDRIPIIRLDWNNFQDTNVIIKKINEVLEKKKGLVI